MYDNVSVFFLWVSSYIVIFLFLLARGCVECCVYSRGLFYNISCENVDSIKDQSYIPYLKSDPLDPVAPTGCNET
jgi:hypothetical protein